MVVRVPVGTPEAGGDDGGRDGDRVRIEDLWAERDVLRRYCERLVGDTSLADDMVQEAYLEAWRKLDTLECRASFLPWLATVAKRRGLNELRGRRYAVPVDEIPEPRSFEQHDPAEVAVGRDDVRRLREALTDLTPRERDLLAQRASGGSVQTLAASEQSSAGSVRSVLLRARSKLRAVVDEGVARVLFPLAGLGSWMRQRGMSLSARIQHAGPSVTGSGAFDRFGELAAAVVVTAAAVVVVTPPAPEASAGEDRRPPPLAVADPDSFEGPDDYLDEAMLAAAVEDVTPGESGRAPETSSGDAAASGESSAPEPPEDEGSATPPLPDDPRDAARDLPEPDEPEEPEPPDAPEPQPEDESNDPEEAHFADLGVSVSTSSPGGSHVFAIGKNAGTCYPDSDCRVLFHSADGGASWERVVAEGMGEADQLLVAPAYPDDPRIYVLGPEGLRLSTDGGASFDPVEEEPHDGPAVMAPGFSGDDQRILVGSAPGWVYDAGAERTTPFTGAALTGSVNHFAFAPDHAESGVLFAGTLVPGPPLTNHARVYRCVFGTCDEGRALGGLRGSPSLAVSSSFAEDGVVFAWGAGGLFRSEDGGLSFEATELPHRGGIRAVVDDGEGTFYLAAVESDSGPGGVFVSEDAGVTWTRVGEETPLAEGVQDLRILDSGDLLAAPVASSAPGILCSSDGGATWQPRCRAS